MTGWKRHSWARSSSPAPTDTVGGTVTGLTGTGLVLQDNTAESLPVSTAGAFHFAAGFANGASYAVTVKTQPSSPTQSCVVTNGSATVGAANVTNVLVNCTDTYTISYTVTGLTGFGLEIGANCEYGGCEFDTGISANGPGTIDVTDGSGNGYPHHFKVETQPSSPTQHCVITNGSGTVGTAEVPNMTVVCANVGRFVYAANAGDNTISVYSIDLSWALTAMGSPAATGRFPYAIAASPDGTHVYVGNEASNDISAYAVDVANGALTPIARSPFATGIDPRALVFNAIPSGTYLYVANNGSNTLSAYAVNASSGALTPVVGSPFHAGGNPHSLVVTPFGPWDPSAALYLYTANFDGTRSTVSGFAVNQATGMLTALSGSPFPLTVSNYIATDRKGAYLYVTTGANVVGYRIDASTVLLTALPGFPVAAGTNAYSVTIDPSNELLLVGDDGSANVSGYTLDAETGSLTAIPGTPFAAGHRPDFLAIF